MFLSQILYQISDLNDLFRIQSYCRFIQNDHVRITQNRLGKSHSLPVTFGQIFDQTVFHICDLNPVHDFFDHFILFVFRDFFQIRRKPHIFQNGHIKIKGRLFRKIAYTFPGFLRFFENIMSVYGYSSLGRGDIAGDNIHGSRLSCAVGAQKTVDFPFLYLKRKVVNCRMVSISLDQIVYFDHRFLLLFYRRRCFREKQR